MYRIEDTAVSTINKKKKNMSDSPQSKGHWIGFSAIILGAIIAGLFSVYAAFIKDSRDSGGTFPYCVKVVEWSDNGSKPIESATVTIELRGFRGTGISDNSGCANFNIPSSLQGIRGNISVAAPNGAMNSTQDIRGPSTTIVYYPKEQSK